MDINLLFKIAAIGILVAVLHQVLVRAGREDQAMMTTLARTSYSSNNGNKRNKQFIWNSKNNIQFINIRNSGRNGNQFGSYKNNWNWFNSINNNNTFKTI